MSDTLKELCQEFESTNDGDVYGNAMGWWFALSDYIVFELDRFVPDEWQFRPSPCGAHTDCYEFQTLQDLRPDLETALQFGNMLQRAVDICKERGVDY